MLPRRVSWLVAAIALTAAAPAHAATMGITGTTIVYQAAPGEGNTVAVSLLPDRVSMSQTAGVLAAGPGCSDPDPVLQVVDCPAAGITDVIVKLGDGDDQALKPATTKPSYRYQVQGGSGKDGIAGTTRSDALSGGTGPDIISGEGGRDKLSGGAGDDSMYGQGRVEGGPGNDNLVLDAGFGRTDVPSTVFGGGGNDRVNARNKVPDIINCGAGKKDRTTADKRGDRISSNC
jgi:Ca2+-binding RTX toxin-like protein